MATTSARPRSDRIQAYRAAEQTHSDDQRDQRILSHLPLVHSVVDKLAAFLPPSVERDDLYHSGVIGLIDAIDRYDPSRETAFSTYAVLRIRGAIIDELRARDWVPRSTRSRARDYQHAVNDLHHQLGRLPNDHELAERLGVSPSELPDIERSAHLASQISLETPIGEGTQLGEIIEHRGSAGAKTTPESKLEEEDQRQALRAILSTLKEQERLVIKLYYFENLLMKDIAAVLSVTESRVCQIHARLMSLLRMRCSSKGLEL
ncbi:MAG: FliA/WhiG family RNA polymerase sigma factor [Planctomycetota bacterium]|nr:MAG: FliA/WhiG family RNA polymerase sigma factor [Planctomycetota bacterium]